MLWIVCAIDAVDAVDAVDCKILMGDLQQGATALNPFRKNLIDIRL